MLSLIGWLDILAEAGKDNVASETVQFSLIRHPENFWFEKKRKMVIKKKRVVESGSGFGIQPRWLNAFCYCRMNFPAFHHGKEDGSGIVHPAAQQENDGNSVGLVGVNASCSTSFSGPCLPQEF